MRQTALQKVVALAEWIPHEEIEKARFRLALLEKGVEFGMGISKNLFGIEQVAKDRLDARLKELKCEQEKIRLVLKFSPYHKLSLEPLKWRNKNGLPELVVFPLSWSWFLISSTIYYWTGDEYPNEWRFRKEAKSALPDGIFAYYNDVVSLLRSTLWTMEKERRKEYRAYVACPFVGLIPNKVREKIHEAKSVFGDNIFLIAEPEEDLTINISARVAPDPLVVGWDGKDIWLIDVFDTTPVEEAMINPHFLV